MLKALERNVASVDERIVLIAPSERAVSGFFNNVNVDARRCTDLIHDVQRFRGSIYLNDGAIQRDDLTTDGRHETPEDSKAWHMVLLNKHQQVGACAIYLEHENTVDVADLRAKHSPLAQDRTWRRRFWSSIQNELARARSERLAFAELGGWAVAPESRRTSGPLTMALAVYGFSRRHGGALGMTTATFRHCSAVILERLGGSRFEAEGEILPPYLDPRYNCMMEMLRFDSRRPNPKYISLIDQLRDKLADVQVFTKPEWATAANPSSTFAAA